MVARCPVRTKSLPKGCQTFFALNGQNPLGAEGRMCTIVPAYTDGTGIRLGGSYRVGRSKANAETDNNDGANLSSRIPALALALG